MPPVTTRTCIHRAREDHPYVGEKNGLRSWAGERRGPCAYMYSMMSR